jgi:hypothetical protein
MFHRVVKLLQKARSIIDEHCRLRRPDAPAAQLIYFRLDRFGKAFRSARCAGVERQLLARDSPLAEIGGAAAVPAVENEEADESPGAENRTPGQGPSASA